MIRLSTGAINSILDTGVYNAFTGPFMRMYMYGGEQPPSADDTFAGGLKCTLTKSSGESIGPAADGKIVLAGSWGGTPTGNGDIGWFRIANDSTDNQTASTTAIRLDGSVSETLGDIILSSVTVVGNTGFINVDEIVLAAEAEVFGMVARGTLL